MQELAENKPYYEKVAKTPLLTREDEIELIKKFKRTGSLRARNKVILANQKFAIRQALKYASQRVSADDLVQEANLALIRAFDKFDPDRGTRFMTYAAWWIRARLSNYTFANASFFKGGTTQPQRTLWFKIFTLMDELLCGGHTREESFEIIARAWKLPAEKVRTTYELRTAKMTDDETASPLAGPDVLAEQKEEQEKIRGLAFGECRREIEREIVSQRLLHEDPMTLSEIGEKHNIGREGVRQLEKKLLKRMKVAA